MTKYATVYKAAFLAPRSSELVGSENTHPPVDLSDSNHLSVSSLVNRAATTYVIQEHPTEN